MARQRNVRAEEFVGQVASIAGVVPQATAPALGDATAPGPHPDAGEPAAGSTNGTGGASSGASGRAVASAPGTPLRLHVERHPADATTRRARRDIFDLAPSLIEEEGRYVRYTAPDEQHPRFLALVESVRVRGGIEQPIGVRTVGEAGTKRFILVYGMRRLRAARRLGLPHVPVRDLGPITEQEALLLQGMENGARENPAPVDDAIAVWSLRRDKLPLETCAAYFGKAMSWISTMAVTGEAIEALTPEEREALRAPGRLRMRDCQTLKARAPVAERATQLRALLARPAAADADEAPDGDDHAEATDDMQADGDTSMAPAAVDARGGRTVRPDERQPFRATETRKGRRFQVAYSERDLREKPREFVDELTTFLRGEVEFLVTRLNAIAEESSTTVAEARALADARDRALNLAEWVRTASGSGRAEGGGRAG